MSLEDTLLKTIESYDSLLEFGAVIQGQERALLYGAAFSRMPHRDADGEKLAWQIADFLPIAAARPLLISRGIQLSEHYARIDSQGRLRTYRLLSDEPVYREAAMLIPKLVVSQRRAIEGIVQISVEYQQTQLAIDGGSLPANLNAGPPILNGPDELCDPLDQRPKFETSPWWLADLSEKRRPWWKFW